MRFQFDVTADKTYKIDYHFNEFWGSVSVRADGVEVWNSRRRVFRDALRYLSKFPLGRRVVRMSALPSKDSEASAFKVGEGKAIQVFISRDVDRKEGFFGKTNYQVFVDYSLAHTFVHTPGFGEKFWKISLVVFLFLILILYTIKTQA